ncbi:hypothetical protein AK830_g9382 [Neonectria ditissima]|uniref:C2H2-type domain-containing protein n=2 Tax=Eukaryota TaxID=2759 RepID=A0A0P7B5T0_9HYPO|nr:hypothetical protein AK830_g9382 [Neonectria ditissima]
MAAIPSSSEEMDAHTKGKASNSPTKSTNLPSSSENNNVIITVSGSAVLRVGGTEIQCSDGEELTVNSSSNSKRESSIRQQTRNAHDGIHNPSKPPEIRFKQPPDALTPQNSKDLILTNSPTTISSKAFLKSLDRARSTLILWSDGYGVAKGELDAIIAQSPTLRQKLSEFLTNIGFVLTKEILPKLGLDRIVQARVLNRLAKEASSYANLGETPESDNDDSPESDSETERESESEIEIEIEIESETESELSSTSELDEMGDFVREIETDVECLLELDAFIRTPTLDLQVKSPKDSRPLNSGGTRRIEATFSSLFFVLIKDRFPDAPFDFVMALSMSYLSRCQRWDNEYNKHSTILRTVSPPSTDAQPDSKLHSLADGSSRIPSLTGCDIHLTPLKCPICRNLYHFSSNRGWQQHALDDMEVWVCHEQGCNRRSEPFATQPEWTSHLENEHGEKTGSGGSAICLHLASHFKDTCLDAAEAVVRYQGLPTKRKDPSEAEIAGSGSESVSESDLEEVEPSTKEEHLPTINGRRHGPSEPGSYALKRAETKHSTLEPMIKVSLDGVQNSQDSSLHWSIVTAGERFPYEIDKLGEGKIMPNGVLLGDREYKCKTFWLPSRGNRLFMLAGDCASMLGYTHLRTLYVTYKAPLKIILSEAEKDILFQKAILPSKTADDRRLSLPDGQVAVVTARSVFRRFGSKAIVNGKKDQDDYWEHRNQLMKKEREEEARSSYRDGETSSKVLD